MEINVIHIFMQVLRIKKCESFYIILYSKFIEFLLMV